MVPQILLLGKERCAINNINNNNNKNPDPSDLGTRIWYSLKSDLSKQALGKLPELQFSLQPTI